MRLAATEHDLGGRRSQGRVSGVVFVALCSAAFLGCGSSTPSMPGSALAGCSTDADCDGGFCDRTGQCGSVDEKRVSSYGMPCTLAPRTPTGKADGKQATCGPYLCVEGRCRSCLEDSECKIEYGAPTCGQLLDARWPGNTCGNYSTASASAPIRRQGKPTPAAGSPTRLTIDVVKTYPHSQQAFTEGLLFHDGNLWESTGNIGESHLRRLVLGTGEEIATVRLEQELFGEGLARQGDRLVQLTLSSERALLWDMQSLTRVGYLPYSGEGWGICHDGKQFVMSNGTSSLQIRDSGTFALQRELEVHMTGISQFRFLMLNELECVDNEVLANVYMYRELVRINLASGEVTALIDTRNLLLHPDVPPDVIDGALDLNGIAYMPENGHYLLTGKYWSRVFEVRFVDDPLFL